MEAADPGDPPPWPVDLGYIVCDACFDGDCADCIGLTHTRPFCGHRCQFLVVVDDGGPGWPDLRR